MSKAAYLFSNASKGAVAYFGGMEADDIAVFARATDWSGESIQIAVLEPDGATWTNLVDGQFTANSDKILSLHTGASLRATVSNGAGSPTGVRLFYAPRFDARGVSG